MSEKTKEFTRKRSRQVYWCRRLRCRRLGTDGVRHKYWPKAFQPISKVALAEWWGNADGINDHEERLMK